MVVSLAHEHAANSLSESVIETMFNSDIADSPTASSDGTSFELGLHRD